jgi:hypothetical protein
MPKYTIRYLVVRANRHNATVMNKPAYLGRGVVGVCVR